MIYVLLRSLFTHYLYIINMFLHCFSNAGNVEILHLGKWGAVCDDEWDARDGHVICRQMGFNETSKVTHNSHFGQASSNNHIILINLIINLNN